MQKYLILLLISCLCNSTTLAAQTTSSTTGNNGWSVSASWAHGRIVRHNSHFLPQVTEPSDVWELHWARHSGGRKQWHQRLNYPVFGFGLLHARLGNSDIFGNAYGVLSSVMFQTRFAKWNINYRIGTGLAYLTRFYHPITNNTNNVIGSPINNVTQVMAGIEYHLSTQWHTTASVSFTHFSNGRTQTPNLGINVPAYGLGLRYIPQLPKYHADTNRLNSAHLDHRWHIALKIGQGIQEVEQPGGPKYSVYVCQLYTANRLSPQWQLHAGIEANYYSANYYLGISQGLYTAQEASATALKIIPYVAGELLLGRVSLYGGLGIYAYSKGLKRGFLPTKIGVQYYLTPADRRIGQQLYIGVYLKSHLSVADYTELGLGYLF